MSDKEIILARIREALAVPSPRTEPHGKIVPNLNAPQDYPARRWLPSPGATFEDHLSAFQKHAADLKAEVRLLAAVEELPDAVRQLRAQDAWTKVGTHQGQLTDAVCQALGVTVCRTDRPYAVRDLESCDAGITECDALVAQTGSVLVTNRSAGGRALSVLPPHHVVLARRSQLVADLPAAFDLLQKLYAGNFPSFISFITGPSRTGDIERILVLGAHGPKKLTIFIV
jgi:L-lactate dehydrogenase complex protein LldG